MGSDSRRLRKSPLVLRQARGARQAASSRDDVDLASLVGRPADASHADAKAVISMQRQAGNRATVHWLHSAGQAPVQRDLNKKIPTPKWTVGRPSSIKAIDASVAALTDKMAKLPGAIDDAKNLIAAVYKSIADFRGSKDGSGKWASAVATLEAEVKTKEGEVDAKIAVRQKGEDRYAVYKSLEPELARYAARTQLTASNFEKEGDGPSIRDALAKPRGAGGVLTEAATDEMTEAQGSEIATEKSGNQDITFAGLSLDQLRTFMAAHKNELTGKTMYPELKNVTDPNGNPDAVKTTAMDLGGVTMLVEHNASDVHLDERLKLIKDAVTKVTAAGVTLPPLKVHLPKYGRSLTVKAADGASGQLGCETTEKSSRAVFIPPDFLHLSSELIGTPTTTKIRNAVTGADEYQFSSTGFDPSGAATIVHELGHVLHFVTAPAKFHGLWGTSFTGTAPSGKATSMVATTEVSQYGNKPREFVAEVFLGLVYGKEFSQDVMSMYRSFGGVIPPAATIKAAAKAL
jgi:hypothetical protein